FAGSVTVPAGADDTPAAAERGAGAGQPSMQSLTDFSRTGQGALSRAAFANDVLPLGDLSNLELHAVREYLGATFNNSGDTHCPDSEFSDYLWKRAQEDPSFPRGTNYRELNGLLRNPNHAESMTPAQAEYAHAINKYLKPAFDKSHLREATTT